MNEGPSEEELEQARETIARQAAEIELLRAQLVDDKLTADFRETLTVLAASGAIASPVSHSRLLEMIVETAANVINARAAALFLVDEEAQELVFEVALGEKADEVEKFRVQLGHGAAGLVAVSGQPLALSDAQSDPRHAAEIARHVGYLPNSLLCVPLYFDDRVIGVLELLDKETAPSFSSEDIEALGLFARQAAIAIEQSLTHRTLAGLLEDLVAGLPGGKPGLLQQRLRSFLEELEESAPHRRSVELASLVAEIASRGESESRACEVLLGGFADYLRSQREPLEELGRLE